MILIMKKKHIGKAILRIKKAPKHTAEWIKSKFKSQKKKQRSEPSSQDAGIDANENDCLFDINAEIIQDINADHEGLASSDASISETVSMFRGDDIVGDEWKNDVEEAY